MGLFSSFTLAFFVFLIAGPVPKGVTLSAPYRCDAYWYYSTGYCYRFFNYYLDWYSAAIDCYYRSSVLVSILSKAEADVVAAYLLSQNTRGSDVWTGLHKRNGTWTWIDSSPPLSYEAWEDGQPDNPYHYCVVVTYSSGYQKWNDVYCYSYYTYVCKKRAYY